MGEQLPVLNKPAAAEDSDEEVAAPAKSRFSAFAMDDSCVALCSISCVYVSDMLCPAKKPMKRKTMAED